MVGATWCLSVNLLDPFGRRSSWSGMVSSVHPCACYSDHTPTGALQQK
ncbi:hypothetical protein Hanom_Chr10g00950391 [Helianthus anomalus]